MRITGHERRWPAPLAALLAALVVFAVSCGKPAAHTGVTIGPKLARLIPADTSILAGIDAASLRAAPFYKQHPQLDALAERIGLNLHRDVSAILVAWSGNRPLVLIERRLPSGTKVMTYGAGSATRGRGGVSEKLRRQLSELRKQDQIWVVSANGLPLLEMPKRTDIASALSNIAGYVKGTSAGLSVDTGLHLRADLTCISDAGARRVRDAFRGGIAFARFTTKDSKLQRLYEAVRVEQNRSEVILQANLPPELSAALAGYAASTASTRRLR
ncbi:MAG: hypothetical protein ACRD4O_08975 [Bryobacteraceae bacterium]